MAINSKLKQGSQQAGRQAGNQAGGRTESEATASRPSGAYKWHEHMINTLHRAPFAEQAELEMEMESQRELE